MQQSEKERPILVIQREGQPDQHWQMQKDEAVVGRDEECDIVLDVREVSRQHIRIFKEGDFYFVEDLESKNGTWVNGQQIKGVRQLDDGDEIHVALVIRIQFIGSGATTPLPADARPPKRGRLRLEPEAHRVFVGGVEVNPPLSLPQYRLLELLYNNAGNICTRDEVVEAVWPDALGEGVSEQAIDALVRRLRDRMQEIDPEVEYIVTVRGHGFRLDNP